MELNKSNLLLAFCQYEKTYGEVKNELGLADGAVYSMLQRLIARGLLYKIREGVYKATPKGITYLKEMMAMMERANANKINSVVSLVVANKIGRSKHELTDAMRLVKGVFFPGPVTRQMHDRIKKIYEDSVPDNDNNSDLIRAMWTAHDKKVCKNHFDFTSAYGRYIKDDKVSNDIKKYWSEDQLFKGLHFFSLSTIERVKRNIRSGR
jgi:hypothetical protein